MGERWAATLAGIDEGAAPGQSHTADQAQGLVTIAISAGRGGSSFHPLVDLGHRVVGRARLRQLAVIVRVVPAIAIDPAARDEGLSD